jgi:hypothetical protein
MGKGVSGKGRSNKTYQNVVDRAKKLYKHLFKASLKRKKKNPQGTYFCDKFKSVDVFLSKVNIKTATSGKQV